MERVGIPILVNSAILLPYIHSLREIYDNIKPYLTRLVFFLFFMARKNFFLGLLALLALSFGLIAPGKCFVIEIVDIVYSSRELTLVFHT